MSFYPSDHDEPTIKLTDGIVQIARERQRQIEQEGWTPEHDDEHANGELARAALCYLGAGVVGGWNIMSEPVSAVDPERFWPWDKDDYRPGDRIRELEKAGALVAAEIDRLLRLRGAAPSGEPGEEGA